MSELLNRLKMSRAAIARVTVGEVPFGLRVLTEQDYLEAGFATDAALKAAGVELSVATADLFEDEKASQLLARALVDPNSLQPVAASARELRQALTRNDRAWLADRYLEHEKQFSPSERTLSADELSALVDEVKKNPATPRLNDSSIATLKRLITALVSPPAP